MTGRPIPVRLPLIAAFTPFLLILLRAGARRYKTVAFTGAL